VNIDPDDDPEFRAAVRSLYLHLILGCVILVVMWCVAFSYLGIPP